MLKRSILKRNDIVRTESKEIIRNLLPEMVNFMKGNLTGGKDYEFEDQKKKQESSLPSVTRNKSSSSFKTEEASSQTSSPFL